MYWSIVQLVAPQIPSTEFPALNLLCASEGYGELVGRGEGEEVGVGWGDREKWRGRGERAEEHSDILLVVFWQASLTACSSSVSLFSHRGDFSLHSGISFSRYRRPVFLWPSHYSCSSTTIYDSTQRGMFILYKWIVHLY